MPNYIKFDGVDGSVEQKDHKKWIVAMNASMGAHKIGASSTGVARVKGKTHLADISVAVVTDKSMPKLLEAAAKGKVFSKVEIESTATYGDEGEQTFLKMELKNAQVTSFSLAVMDDDTPVDYLTLSLNYEEVKQTYTEYGKDGAKGGNVEFSWKVEEGES